MTKAVDAFVIRSGRGCGGHPGIEDTGRLPETARPQLSSATGEQHLGTNPRTLGGAAAGDPAFKASAQAMAPVGDPGPRCGEKR